MMFNDIEIVAIPGDHPSSLEQRFHEICKNQRAEYEASPAGKKAKAAQAESEKRAAAAEAEGILPFELMPGDKLWESWVKVNVDPYGACTVRYAARWANYMERELAQCSKHITIADIAEATGHEADKEGITGFMYGCAVSMLAKAWKHGEALRQWHNIKTQIKDEGEKANKEGGTLNPALLNIG